MKVEGNNRTGAPQHVYAREPLRFQGAIPVFSASNEYTDNYERISGDHVASHCKDGTNPFIPNELWDQMESSTIELMKKYSSPGDMVLDVGVGLGRLLSYFPDLQRYGMDISFSYLEIAEKKGIEVCYALVEDMPYKEGVFDIVVCTDVLEHVTDLNLAVKKILSVLSPTGFLIVRTPYKEDLSWYISSENPYEYVHLRTFDENTLQLLFERVFLLEVVEMIFAGYKPYSNRLKFGIPFPRGGMILERLFNLVRPFFPLAYEKLLRNWFDPVEINVVVRKK